MICIDELDKIIDLAEIDRLTAESFSEAAPEGNPH